MTLILEDAHVRVALPMAQCLEAMEAAFRDQGLREAVNFPRIRYACNTPAEGVRYGANIHIGAVPASGVAAVRMGSFTGGSLGHKVQQHQQRSWGIICLFSLETGELLAILQEFGISGIRVGATTALGVKYLAREDASTLGLFGSGKLARTHLEAIALVRPLRLVKVFSPNPEHRRAFAYEMSEQLGVQVVAVDEPREVVRGVDIIACATNASYRDGQAVFDGAWLEPGQLVTSIQNSDVHGIKSEVDETTFARAAAIVINETESVHANNQQELLGPIERGIVSWNQVHELGAIVAGQTRVETAPEAIVYFKNNTGMGIQMAAAGAVVYANARRLGLGHEVPTEWFGTDLTAWYEKGYAPSP